jgi:hypothetical protein
MKMKYVPLVFAVALLGNPVSAQTPSDATKSDAPRPRISLIAVGDPPSPEYSIQDGKRVLGKTVEDDYPPSLLYVKDKSEFKQVCLGLNFPAEPIRHPGGEHFVLFESKEEKKESFLRVAVPAANDDLTVFLVRNNATGSWRQKPVARVFRNGLDAFPLNSLRVLNFSRLQIKVNALQKAFSVDSKESRVIPLPPSEQGILPYKIAVEVEGKLFMVADTAITYPMNGRINLVAYESDGNDKRQPVRVLNYFELPYRAPAKEKEPK